MAEADRPRVESVEPLDPSPIPSELAAFLIDQGRYACVTQATNQGTAYILKAPASEITRAQGTVRVHLRHELYGHRAAPVIRTLLTIYDQPDCPLRFETFTNIADELQRADFAALADQKQLILLFYDESLVHRLKKVVPAAQHEVVPAILEEAQNVLALIPTWRYDFDRAKAAVLRETEL